jgi:hypothetical protein
LLIGTRTACRELALGQGTRDMPIEREEQERSDWLVLLGMKSAVRITSATKED